MGVIRPTAEVVGQLTKSGHIGVLATSGTIKSDSYRLEIQKLHPECHVTGLACPMWVPIIENGEYDKPGADYFVRDRIEALLAADPLIDTIILGCTHYPLLLDKIRKYCPPHITLVPQGRYIAESLETYLLRHQDMDNRITRGGTCRYFTTESADEFRESASLFLREQVDTERIVL